MPVMFGCAGGTLLLALIAALADRRRRLRDDPDRVGWVDWRTVQMAALLATILLVSLGLHTR
ncbi:hypothetical protein M9979_16410 [Sphingomonas sp. RP10(2022)]|uniref:Uncharacterized protein n=1 Tax=Sphingomonas liriopis TaxID=2949094 RepID=A0A9X2KS80_9SPHN|nr:hypothetical protein [Sphingomonas liriopis]MCP3736451.1 hypothetical protein [Sphingomonas liriopis]